MATHRAMPPLFSEPMQGDERKTAWTNPAFKPTAAWFMLAGALVYVTGLLIAFTFLHSYGLHDVGTNLLRIKYIYIGTLFAAFPAAIFFCVILLFDLREVHALPAAIPAARQPVADFDEAFNPIALADEVIGAAVEKSPHSNTSIRLQLIDETGTPPIPAIQEERQAVFTPPVALTLNVVTVFYILVTFAPPNYYRDHEFWANFILCATAFGLFIPRAIEKITESHVVAKYADYFRWALLALLLAADVMLFRNATFLGDLALSNAWSFGLFVLISGYLARRILLAGQTIGRGRDEVLTVLTCLFAASYLLTALSFAFAVYPFIPAANGGGDFSHANTVVLYFKPEARNLPPALSKEIAAVPAPQPVPTPAKRGQIAGAAKTAKQPEATPQPQTAPGLVSRNVVVIDETAEVLFVADPNEKGGPASWRLGEKPRVHAVRRDDLSAVEYQN